MRWQVIRDYAALMKLRVVSLLLLVTVAAAVVASDGTPSLSKLGLLALIGLLAAGGCGAINSYFDRDIDTLMSRTRRRPLPSNRIQPSVKALIFGLTSLVLSLALAIAFLNLFATLFILLGAFFYVVVYTLWLKRRSWTSILVGGFAGCCPALTGWAAVTGTVSSLPVIMAILVLVWIPGHNWLFSMLTKSNYTVARIPVLPTVVGDGAATKLAFVSSLLLFALSSMPYVLGYSGGLYLSVGLLAGLPVLATHAKTIRAPSASNVWSAYKMLSVYLAALFVGLVLDSLTGAPFGLALLDR